MKSLLLGKNVQSQNKLYQEKESIILKNSSKENTFLNTTSSLGVGHLHLGNNQMKTIDNKLAQYEEKIKTQNEQIKQLEKKLKQNEDYTRALQQKYTILLQAIQPCKQHANPQLLVKKIADLEAQIEQYKAQEDLISSEFKSFKIIDPNNISLSNQMPSTTIDQLSERSQNSCSQDKSSQTSTQLFQSIQKNEHNTKNRNRVNSQNKIRKQSTDSDVGVQVILQQKQIYPVVKRNNLKDYMSQEHYIKEDDQHLNRKRKNSQYEDNQSLAWQKTINEYIQNEQEHNIKFKYKTINLLKKNIPHQLRSTVWPMVFQNHLGITCTFYMELLQRRQKGWVQEAVRIQIEKDLVRSFTGKGKQIKNKEKIIHQVREVLELFHIYRPDVSYVQGMTYPAIVLTSVVGKMKAFCILSNSILSIPFFKRLYTFEDNYPSIYCRTFDILLKQTNAGAYQLLKKKNIFSQIFLIQWFYTFFSRGLSFETILKIWDHFAYHQQVVFFKIALTIIQLSAKYIKDTPYQGSISLIKQYSSYIDQKKLIQTFVNNKVTEERYKRAYRKALKHFKTEKK